jgi:GT2 family glycosyltransferase
VRRVSVVVPTRDRTAALERCLTALREQEEVPELELIVVDDGGSQPEAVAMVVERVQPARLLRLGGQGPAAARNAGVRAATGEIVLLTDDDCVPGREWAARLCRRLEAGDVEVVSGATLPGRRDDLLLVASQTVSTYAAERVPLMLGNNLGCRRKLLLAHPFDEAFGEAAGEDREWSERLRRNGVGVALEPEAIVWHHAELDLRSFWHQHLRYGRAAAARPGRRALALQPWRFYSGLLRAGFAHGRCVGLLVCLSQLATALGRLSGQRRR